MQMGNSEEDILPQMQVGWNEAGKVEYSSDGFKIDGTDSANGTSEGGLQGHLLLEPGR